MQISSVEGAWGCGRVYEDVFLGDMGYRKEGEAQVLRAYQTDGYELGQMWILFLKDGGDCGI